MSSLVSSITSRRASPQGLLALAGAGIALGLTPIILSGGSEALPIVVMFLAMLFLAGTVLSVRFAWLPVALYWILYSFFSDIRSSQFTANLGSLPITVPDLAVLLLAFGLVFRVRATAARISNVTPIRLGFGLILADALFAAVTGLARGYSLYSIAIDLRTILYLAIGYWAGRQLVSEDSQMTLIRGLLWLSLVGLVIEQALVSFAGIGAVASAGGQLQNYRDIGVSFFAGKYGIILATLVVGVQGIRNRWSASLLLVAGFFAMAATLVRTAWVAAIAGMAAAMALMGWKGTARLVAIAGLTITLVAALAIYVPPVKAYVQAAQDRAVAPFDPRSTVPDTIGARLDESRSAIANLSDPVDWIAGSGLGLTVRDALHPYQENSFVAVLTKEGIIGLTLFTVVVFIMPIVVGLRALGRVNLGRWILLVALISAQIANAVSGYSSGNATNWEYAPIIGMTIAWIYWLARAEGPRPGNARIPASMECE